MNLPRLRELLLRGQPKSSLQSRPPGGRRRAVPQAVVVGRRMVAGGCESLVSRAGRQRRVVLRDLGPGDVVKTPARFFDDIVAGGRLPPRSHCRLWTGSRWVRPRPMPCIHNTEDRACTRCQWMGLAATASREIKAEKLRRAMESSLPLSSSSSPQLSVRFLDPFDVPITEYSMREMEFYFRTPSNEERPSSADGEKSSGTSTGRFCFSLNSTDGPECCLSTLEQQRLLLFLNRWAERLPQPLQQCLCSVFILQHPHENVTRSWECDLHVTLLLRQDVATFGEKGPLCSPSQSDGVFFLAEQQLVDAVLSSAPLTKRLGVTTVLTDGYVSCLYPRLRRMEFLTISDVTDAVGVVPCVAVHAPSGKSVIANLPFMHSTIQSALGRRDLTILELSPPSLWRHPMSLEAVGSLLLSLLGDFEEVGIILFLPDPSCSLGPDKAFTTPRTIGSHVLGVAVSQWLRGCTSKMSVVHVAKGEGRKGKGAVDPKALETALSSLGEGPTIWFCLVDIDTNVDAVTNMLQYGVTLPHQGSCSAQSKKVVLLQLAADGEFHLLASVIRAVTACVEERLLLRLDCGVVDIDPWTAATVGYVVMELSS